MFAQSVNAKNIQAVYDYISSIWQAQVTVEKLNETFKVCMDQNIDLSVL